MLVRTDGGGRLLAVNLEIMSAGRVEARSERVLQSASK